MVKYTTNQARIFILDTNVLIHDPSAIFRFHEHDVYIPMIVLEELDNIKKGLSDIARNVRQTSRIFDELINQFSGQSIEEGIPLSKIKQNSKTHKSGRLFFQTADLGLHLPDTLPGNKADNSILATAMGLKKTNPDKHVTLVTKDINLRVKANILGLHAEDYYNDRVLEDAGELHSGLIELHDDFWEKHSKNLESWKENHRTYYRVHGPDVINFYPNDCVAHEKDNFLGIVKSRDQQSALIEVATDYYKPSHAVWGISARNREQNLALNLLMDPDIDFVTLQGSAGTGKTLMALAAGLSQTLDQNIYRDIIMTRATVPVGEDIGFLPGTEEEKMIPWMGALMDNLEVLCQTDDQDEWGKNATQDILMNRLKIRSLNFMRGRTFLNKYVIIDEAQNLTSKQMKTLITRAGPGTKIVCLGDIHQIDTPYLTDTTSGLTYAVDRFKEWEHSAHMTLVRGERSRLADFAANAL